MLNEELEADMENACNVVTLMTKGGAQNMDGARIWNCSFDWECVRKQAQCFKSAKARNNDWCGE